MLKKLLILGFVTAAAPVFAGDVGAGQEVFEKQCKNCHRIQDDAGNVIAGRENTKTGPNLYGVIGRQAGTDADFGKKYGDDLVKLGESGFVWTAEELAVYVKDPRDFLKTKLDDKRAKSKMAFKLRKEDDAANIAAYLASITQ